MKSNYFTRSKAMRCFYLVFFCMLFSVTATAQENSIQKDEEYTTYPLSIYSFGLGLGASMALNPELKDLSNQFFKLSVINSFTYTQNMSFDLDFKYLLPENGLGSDLNLILRLPGQKFKPFAGVGAGVFWIDHDELDFGEEFSFSVVGQAGAKFALKETLDLWARGKYTSTFNQYNDNFFSFGLGFSWSSSLKNVQERVYK